MKYRVKWELDVEADTPEQAAQKALQVQRDPESMAAVFEVFNDKESLGMFDLDRLEELLVFVLKNLGSTPAAAVRKSDTETRTET